MEGRIRPSPCPSSVPPATRLHAGSKACEGPPEGAKTLRRFARRPVALVHTKNFGNKQRHAGPIPRSSSGAGTSHRRARRPTSGGAAISWFVSCRARHVTRNQRCEDEAKIDRASGRIVRDLDEVEISGVQMGLQRAAQAGGFMTVDRDYRVAAAVIV
jgi:hypothetical protein